ncbi:caspase family protein [Streptomyces sp. NPDC047880]|uniref:caspase family protein n=1 Tax=Streptomyces sp. NPDC047880 TaxID=3155626 RepID=UPI0034546042
MGEAGGGSMRYVVAAGTRRYREGPELHLAHEDADRAAALFASMGYERVLTGVSYDPRPDAFEDALAEWCRTADLTADDIVVLYYAGHGDRSSTGQYRLACADSEQGRPRSWLSLANLAEILADSPVRNVLFVVDACHAAAAGADIGRVTDAIVAARGRADSFGAGTWLLASARHRDLADDGAFVAELAKACERGDGPSQRYLAPDTLADRVNQRFIAAGSQQRAACSSVDHSERPPFFVNPCFDPYAEITGEGLRGDASDLSSHFEPRGRGVEHVHDPGSYFTGRVRALEEVRAHLAGKTAGRLLVVTADPGSGKSAVLGRLVLEGHADASVNAHHQTLEALVGRFAAAADVRAATSVALFTALTGRERPLRIVVDSLDEAGVGGGKAEARRIAWDLLRPLAALPCIRLVVGSRRELLPHLGDGVPVVDLDEDAYTDDTDTAEYVAKVLSDTGAPYADCPGTARRVAREVARRAGRCFLVARMTASALLRGPVVDTSVPGWSGQLPSDVGGAFEAYLQRMPPERHTTTMALLMALAFGEGYGLPRRMWIRAAERLAGIPLAEADADLLLDEDASYLAHARVDGTTYFRLYHQELTDHIKSRVLRRRDLGDVQECFVETLLEFVPDRDWSRAHPYVCAHLATHAAGAGALDDLIEDAGFLVAADPSTLLPAVREAVRRPMLTMAVERFAYLLVDADAPSADPAALLAYVAGAYGEDGLRRGAERLARSLERVDAERRRITPHRVVGRHAGDAYASRHLASGWRLKDCTLPWGGRVVLAVPPGAAHVHVWMLDNPSQSTVLPHPTEVDGLVLLRDESGRAEAATLDARGTLRVWNVVDQTLTRTLAGTGWTFLYDAGVLHGDTDVVVCGTESAVLAVALPGPATLVEVPCRTRAEYTVSATPSDTAYTPGGSACLFHDAEGLTRLLVCDGTQGHVTLYDLDGTGHSRRALEGLVRPRLVDHVHRPDTLAAVIEHRTGLVLLDAATGPVVRVTSSDVTEDHACFARSGKASSAVFVAKAGAGFLVVPADGSPVQTVDHLPRPTFRMAAALVDGRVQVVTSFFSHPLVVVDGVSGTSVGFPLTGHESAVGAVHLLEGPESGAGPDILAIANDGTVRLWAWNAHRQPVPGTEESDAPEDSRQEVDMVCAWSGDPTAVLTLRDRQLVRTERPCWDEQDRDARRTASPIEVPVDFGQISEDPDGTFNLLQPENQSLVWTRLGSDGQSSRAVVGSVATLNAFVLAIPATAGHEGVRWLAFDRGDNAICLLDSPEAPLRWVPLPDLPHAERERELVEAFTTPEGATMLFVYGNAKHPDASRAHGQLFDITSGAPVAEDAFELPGGIQFLLPHHGRAGTRWVAQECRGGALSVLDVTTRRQSTVPRVAGGSLRYAATRRPGRDRLRYLRWADLPTGGPLLLSLSRHASSDASPGPVTVWNPDTPDVVDRLAVPACRLLWTGASPNGEALVAVSDEHGIALCHLPSLEKVWSAPLPALVTCMAALPCSPHLDLAVGTQQGVVFMRPRLSRVWRDRLGTG